MSRSAAPARTWATGTPRLRRTCSSAPTRPSSATLSWGRVHRLRRAAWCSSRWSRTPSWAGRPPSPSARSWRTPRSRCSTGVSLVTRSSSPHQWKRARSARSMSTAPRLQPPWPRTARALVAIAPRMRQPRRRRPRQRRLQSLPRWKQRREASRHRLQWRRPPKSRQRVQQERRRHRLRPWLRVRQRVRLRGRHPSQRPTSSLTLETLTTTSDLLLCRRLGPPALGWSLQLPYTSRLNRGLPRHQGSSTASVLYRCG
mmetsp:Transcript_10871/g.32312  ORF Transcript_10871/g.32312 Transcript_10871/m.32312 type:complete len:257 (+) Transcript_10871:1025-1795(+)